MVISMPITTKSITKRIDEPSLPMFTPSGGRTVYAFDDGDRAIERMCDSHAGPSSYWARTARHGST